VDDAMQRLLSILSMLAVTPFLSGCIVSASLKEDVVVFLGGQAQTFTINVFLKALYAFA